MKEENEQAGLKFNIQTKIMASGPTISWQLEGEIVEVVTDLFSWSLQSLWMVTAAMKLKDTCSWKEKL